MEPDASHVDQRQIVRSPELVALELPLAGAGSRIVAFVIDFAVIALLQVGLFLSLGGAALVALPKLSDLFPPLTNPNDAFDPRHFAVFFSLLAFYLVLQMLLQWCYFIAWEIASDGRSFGKRLLRLRVVSDDGRPATARQYVLRNLLRAVDVLPATYLCGLITMLASRRCQRLGDIAAGTLVVRLDTDDAAVDVPLAADPAAAGFVFTPAQIALLGDPERRLIRQTLRRLPTLPAEAGNAALDTAVRALSRRLGYDGVPAERRDEFLRAALAARAHGGAAPSHRTAAGYSAPSANPPRE